MITATQLVKIMPACKNAAVYAELFNELFPKFDITTKKRQAAFISQVGHESGSLNRLIENLNYSAQGLATTWPGRYSTGKKIKVGNRLVHEPNLLAQSLHRRPEAIANNCYANRLGNGNEQSGEGWKYRGRGLMQITGKANYQMCSAYCGLDLVKNPELLEQRRIAVETALCFWRHNDLNRLADKISDTKPNVTDLTQKINGGTHGLKERLELYTVAMRVLG